MSVSITATTDNNSTDVGVDQTVTITVTTTDTAIVIGTPTLTLNNNEVATFTDGSETKTLIFTYTVQPGDDIADLQVTGLNLPDGATITIGDEPLTDLSQDLGLQIDTVAPTLPPTPDFSTLVDPSAVYTTNANGINDSGQIVGNYNDETFTSHGFIESGGTFTTIDDPLATNGTVLNGINDNGQVVGYYYDANNVGHSFIYSNGNYTALEDPLAANGTYAFGINDSGQVVGYYYDINNIGHSFLYGDGNYATIDDPSAVYGSFAFGINDSGQVVGYYYDDASPAQGFLYSNGTYTTIDYPSAVYGSFAFGINNAGEIIGSYNDNNFASHGYVEHDGRFVTLDNPQGTDTSLTGINTAGDIVGSFFDSTSGKGFVLDPPALPVIPVAVDPAGGTADIGQTITFTVTLTEQVVVDASGGTPELTLNDGGSAVYDAAATAALNDATKLVFSYTVGATDTHVSALAITGVDLNGATVQDLASNNADLTGIATTFNALSVICFMPGTLIATPNGDRPVEALERGDLILTRDGRTSPVRWIGRQTVSARFGDPLRILPIRIKAGALADNVPSRDLLLSPDHAILINDVLISAGALVNGTSIIREINVSETFTYYHVELDDHSLILAHNVPSETFVDHVERLSFDNWKEHEAFYPQGKPIVEMQYPRAKARRQVPRAIRETLAQRGICLYGILASIAA